MHAAAADDTATALHPDRMCRGKTHLDLLLLVGDGRLKSTQTAVDVEAAGAWGREGSSEGSRGGLTREGGRGDGMGRDAVRRWWTA